MSEEKSARRRKRAYLISGTLLVLVSATVLQSVFVQVEGVPMSGKALFFLLINLNILALIGLAYFLGRNLVGLYGEWRDRTLGYRFKTKVIAMFLTITAIPLGLLFLVSSGLGTNYIDRFFTPHLREPIENSVRVVTSLYEMERLRALRYAEATRSGDALPTDYKVEFIKEMPENPSATVREAFNGRADTEVISSELGDIVRAAIPFDIENAGNGIIVVERTIPSSMTRDISKVVASYEDYMKLEAWKSPLKLNYLLVLGFFTIIIIFSALWASLKIAGWITEPVKNLAAATEELAAGNLSVNVRSRRRDEMGLLIDSFNRMVREMREDKESLQKAYLNMENIVKNINSGVISMDENGVIREINSSACRILAASGEDIIGRHYSLLTGKVDSLELNDMLKSIKIKELSSVEREVRAVINGANVLLRVSITGLKGPKGEHLGLLVVFDDLTDIIKVQRVLAWQEVARRMAHEIKNPLTPIRLSTERMLKKWQEKDPEFDQIFERSTTTIIREVEGLKHLVNEFSRMGRMPEVTLEPADINLIIGDVVNLYKGYKEFEIVVERPDDLPVLSLDAEQFKRALINLIDNAREAMMNSGEVIVRLQPNKETKRLYIEIADEGPGIDDTEREKLFQPYFSTKKDGTGLGLVIADKIIAEHGGHIRVRNNVPSGCVFTIEIPMAGM